MLNFKPHLNLHAIVFRPSKESPEFPLAHLQDNWIILSSQLCLILKSRVKYCGNFDFEFLSSIDSFHLLPSFTHFSLAHAALDNIP